MRKVGKFIFFFCLFVSCFNVVKADELVEGIYTIESFNNKVLEAQDSLVANMTNVRINDRKQTDNQKWRIKDLYNGYYKITSLDSKFNFDVAWGGYSSGTNVWMYTNNNTKPQSWYLKETSDGYYNIISAYNNLYLDVAGGKFENGTNIQVYNGNGTNAQKFKLIEDVENKKVLEEGDYIIHTYDYNQVIDLSGACTNNHTNIQSFDIGLYENHAQIWHLKYLTDGYYQISSTLDNNKVFDLTNSGEVSGNNIQLFQNNGNNAQKWIIKDAGDGYFNILTIYNHRYLDVAGGVARNNANIQVYRGNGTNAQKFKFEKVEFNKLEDGMYNISSKLDNSKVIGLDSEVASLRMNVSLRSLTNSNSQKWYVKNLGYNIYSISSVADLNRSLDVAGADSNNHANVQVFNSNGTNAQKWYIKYVGDGYYTIISQLSYRCLDVNGSKTTDRTNIQIYDTNYNDAQKFKFVKTEKNYFTKSYDDGYYQISSLLDENKVLDVNGAIIKNGSNVQLFGNNNSLAQVWHLKYLSDGYYLVTSALNTNVSLDAKDSGMVDGTNVQVYKKNNLDSEKWLIKDYGNGIISIISKSSGLYVDVAGANTSNGTNIQLYGGNDSNAQKFKLTKYTNRKLYKGIDVSKYQKDIDWNKVSASGVNFAIIRLGFGAYDTQEDKKLLDNVRGCEENNIPYAVYLYSYAKEEDGQLGAKAEAEFTVRVLNKLKSLGYSPNMNTQVFYDMEDDSTYVNDKNHMTGLANKYCSTINQSGYSCGIYANKNWLENVLNAKELESKYNIWLAHYTGPDDYHNALSRPSSYNLTKYKYWQFSSLGDVDGIKSKVDLNYGYDIFD